MNPSPRARPLQVGDAVAPVAASSALSHPERLQQGLAILNSWGLECLPAPAIDRHWGYLAGTDDQRRSDLQVSAPLLACARGGWGAARLLEGTLPWQPGWLLGFSDVTALLWARLSAGFDGNVHGPMLTTLPGEPSWSQERLHNLLFGASVEDLHGEGLGGGDATGPLVVANLTVATHLLGSRHLPDLRGAILILEDVGEAPYRLDRMLTHWRLCGELQKLAGIGFGNFEGCGDAEDPSGLVFDTETVIRERTADLCIPRVRDLPVGHRPGNAALPLGRLARLDGDRGKLSLLP